MICSLLFALLSLTPITEPVSCGLKTEFRLMHGVVPMTEWSSVPGLPFSDSGTFSEVTFHSGTSKCFRALSSGATAGLHPSIGSYVNRSGYAGFLQVKGFQVTVCEFQNGFNPGFSFRGISAEARDALSDDPAFFAEYSWRNLLLAGGENTFAGGIQLDLTESLSLGPAWCRDRELSRFWVSSDIELGPLRFQSGGAVVDSSFSRRANLCVNTAIAELTAGYDEEDLFGRAKMGYGPAEFCLSLPEWGFLLLVKPDNRFLLSLSHREGGVLQGEVQMELHGVVAGGSVSRFDSGEWNCGFTFGISTGTRYTGFSAN